MIAVSGRLKAESYTDNEGTRRKAVVVEVAEASFCGVKQQEPRSNESDFEEIPDYDEP